MKTVLIAAIAAAVATPAIAQTTTPDPVIHSDVAATAAANNSGASPDAAPMPATGEYPMCSLTITDHCTERSNASGARLHSTPRPPHS